MADESALSFPGLFRESYVDYADCRTTYTTEAAPDDLVARLHLVAVTADGNVVVCRSEQGWRFLPGGTREPGESLDDLARRELMEEAGAVLEGEPRYFAAHVADSNRDKPFRSHLPHPRTYWATPPPRSVSSASPPTPKTGRRWSKW